VKHVKTPIRLLFHDEFDRDVIKLYGADRLLIAEIFSDPLQDDAVREIGCVVNAHDALVEALGVLLYAGESGLMALWYPAAEKAREALALVEVSDA